MKTIKQALKLRESIFDETKRDDTLDLDNLASNSIDADRFFNETYITEGMKLLLDTVFKRLRGQTSAPIVKLTQAMGGGKTHNMLAVGLLAQNPSMRNKVLNGRYSDFKQGVKVVAYTGRETGLKYGIWGEIARQLGKENQFAPYYSPMQAPGQSAWVELLKSDTPTLILLDELPPYLDYCKTQTYGTGTLLDITTPALANLFNALNKAELHNVTLVISDLDAAYQSGSSIIRGMFDNLQNEVHRSSVNIEPVGANTDDLYHILRTRLFENNATDAEINEIALAYQASLQEAKSMSYTDEDPKALAKGVRDSYPFHPSIRDLFARFKENDGFQQTRGFIRLTREMVKGIWAEDGVAGKRYLVNPYDLDLNNPDMASFIKAIKPELSNAISHDIASGGKSAAELLDAPNKSSDMQDVAKLILMSSLGKSHGTITGLTESEAIAYVCAPNKDIRNLYKELAEFKQRAWYMYSDKNGRLFFRQVQNVNAKLMDEIKGFTVEQAKLHIKTILESKFKPIQGDCYQEVLVFPSIDDIKLKKDKVTLIVTEPNPAATGLKDELKQFYDDATYKNRVMFLTGQRVAMADLLKTVIEYKAIEGIVHQMVQEDKLLSGNSELIQAQAILDKKKSNLLTAIRETFVLLYVPKKQGLTKTDFELKQVSGESTQGDILTSKFENDVTANLAAIEKFTVDIAPDTLRAKFVARIFTQRRMAWGDILDRAASDTSWQWHKMRAFDDLKSESVRKGLWIEDGGYVDKEPPAPVTSVSIMETHRDSVTGEVTLKIQAIGGDTVYFEIDADATTASSQVADLSNFKTSELNLTFLCVDTSGVNTTGEVKSWQNKVILKYGLSDREGIRYMELLASSPNVEIRYTTDGSNPESNGGIYREPFEIMDGVKYVQAIAVNQAKGIKSETLVYEVKEGKKVLRKDAKVKLGSRLSTKSTPEAYAMLESLKEANAVVSDVELTVSESSGGFVTLSLGDFKIANVDSLIGELNQLVDKFFVDKKYEVTVDVNKTEFNTGVDFEQWVAKRKETVDKYAFTQDRSGDFIG